MTDRVLALLKTGYLYLHGRAKDHSPIIVLDMGKMVQLIKDKELDNFNFCGLFGFLATYIKSNMLLDGQVEKWLCLCNLN